MSILPPAPVITKVAQLGNTFKTTAEVNGKVVPVYVGFIEQDGLIELVYVYRDPTGHGDFEEVRTSPEWKELTKQAIAQDMKDVVLDSLI